MRQQFQIGRLTATGTRSAELKEREKELAGFDIHARNPCAIQLGDTEKKVEIVSLALANWELRSHVDGFVSRICLVLGGTYLNAKPASGAILRRHLQRIRHTLKIGRLIRNMLKMLRGTFQIACIVYFGANGGVGADEGTFIALYTELSIPLRYFSRNITFFPL